MAKVHVLGTVGPKCGYLLKNTPATASERQADLFNLIRNPS